jgi:hypothetical protein
MRPDLRGESITIAGADVREGTIPPIVVLEAGGADQTFRVIASNIPGLAGAPADAPPPVLGAMDPIQIVFSLPADEDTFLVDFKNEDGTGEVAARIVPGVLGNVFLITHDAPLATGQEYNVSIRVQTSATNPGQTLQRSASFFVRGDPATPVRARGNFVDGGRDSLWGSGNDRLELTLDVPVGRAGQNPAFVAQLFVELDLDGSLAIGDGRGELPQLGSAYPTPILVSAREPSPGNGAPSTGFTRFFAPVAIDLVSPLTQLQGPVAFEIRIDKADNGSVFVTDAEGRPAPAKIEGTAQLISP